MKNGAALQTRKQKTLQKSVVLSGQGLHSGVKTGLILHPLPANSGILFAGISGDVTLPAHLDYVGSTGYATSLRPNGFAVGTVEHLLAVMHSYGITNLLVKVQGEVPIIDGSARGVLPGHRGSRHRGAGRRVHGDRHRPALPDRGERRRVHQHRLRRNRSRCHYRLRYPEPVGEQEYTYVYGGPESFKNEIAPARTFGFLRDIEKLQTMGLASGGKLNNCIIIGDDKIINTDLRFPTNSRATRFSTSSAISICSGGRSAARSPRR